LDAVRLVIAVSASGSRQTPLSLLDRKQFAQYTASLAESLPYVRDFIVGNEPNLNRFWMPQFDKRGRDLAAPAYEALLARTYDALKMVSPHITVIGGAVSPRGADRAKSARQTHSPTTFLRDLGTAYRKSGRSEPIMDMLVIHPYGETSKTPPTALHPKSTSISIADYPKLVKMLRDAFRGTAQRGASLPILYGEYGVQTQIPFDKLGAYTNFGGPCAARPLNALPRWRCQQCSSPAGRNSGASIRRMSGQYVSYTFYRVDPAWRRLPIDERAAGKDAFAEVVEDWAGRMDALRAYSVAGVRPDCDFFLWKITERYDDLGELGAALNGTPLAAWLETPYSYLATTKASEYTSARKARKIAPRESPYLVVYPFVKVRPWYALPEEDRRRAMDEHIRIGREEFPTIHNHTTYSFGIDDQEFMTAFECDEPADFMHLMLRLRDSEASRYTERDTPIFVGKHVAIREALAALDGAEARERGLAEATS